MMNRFIPFAITLSMLILVGACVDTLPVDDATDVEPSVEPDDSVEPKIIELVSNDTYYASSPLISTHPIHHLWNGRTDNDAGAKAGSPNHESLTVVFDFGSVHRLRSIRLFPDLDGAWITSEAKIELSNGTRWIVHADAAVDDEEWIEYGSGEARYLRLTLSSDTGRVEAREFSVRGYGSGETGTTLVEVPIVPDEPLPTASRYNLIVSDEELLLWRERERNGPYRTYGNPGPGDWSLVEKWKESFMRTPALWQPSITHHSQLGLRDPPSPHRQHLGAASFWALLHEDADIAGAVRDQIGKQARITTLDWSDRSIYPTSGSGAVPSSGNPFFDISGWMVNIGRAYLETDYAIRTGLIEDWSDSDRRRIEQWFIDYADLMKDTHDRRMDELFVDRYAGEYSFTSRGRNDRTTYDQGYTHAGGYRVNRLIHFYNNREANNVRAIGFIGAMFKGHQVHGDRASDFMDTARLHVIETLRYASVADDADYTTGYEYYRSSLAGDRTTGYGYEAGHMSALVDIVWDLARIGYWDGRSFSTTLGSGAHNNPLVGNPPKSLRNRMRVFAGISDANAPQNVRYRHAADMQGNPIGQYYMNAHWFTMTARASVLWPNEDFVEWYTLPSNYENSERHWGPQESYYEGDRGANTGFKSMNGVWGNDVALYWKVVGLEDRFDPFPVTFDVPVGSE